MCLCVQSVYIEVVAPCWYVFVSSILIIICAQARVNYYESEVKQLSLMSLSLSVCVRRWKPLEIW